MILILATLLQISSFDSLLKYAAIPGSKIQITGTINLKSRITVADSVEITGGTLTSKLWYNTFRVYESIAVKGNGVKFTNVTLIGDDKDIREYGDTSAYQTGIQVYGYGFQMKGCRVAGFGYCGLFCHRFVNMTIDSCYFLNNKNFGYGYGIWLEGKPGDNGVIKNCVFEDNRESIDQGGHATTITLQNNQTDRAFCCHRNDSMQMGTGATLTGNRFYDCPIGYYPPPPDSGYFIATGNYLTGDSTYLIVDANKKVITAPNFYNWIPPVVSFKLDSVTKANRVYITLKGATCYQIEWGDARTETTRGIQAHTYKPGIYFLSYRGVVNGTYSEWKSQKIVIGNVISVALKSTARFKPLRGYYKVEVFIDSTLLGKYDAVDLWNWKRYSYSATGKKLTVKVTCIKDCSWPVMFWFDDLNNKSINQGFEDDPRSYSPWRQTLIGSAGGDAIGSGIDIRERASGKQSWRFEFRGSYKVGASATISQ